MDPVGSVIIPEMVILVVGFADRQGGMLKKCCAHGSVSSGWRWHTRKPGNKKAPFRSGKALIEAWRDFCSADFSPPHIERIASLSHRGISPSPVGSLWCHPKAFLML
jgi:hypothetical protein